MAASESVATKTALAALATAALGGVGGQYALILVGAFGGAALPSSKVGHSLLTAAIVSLLCVDQVAQP
jgi:hypothetical protein